MQITKENKQISDKLSNCVEKKIINNYVNFLLINKNVCLNVKFANKGILVNEQNTLMAMT
jgi:hypothetical protein